MHIAFTYFLDLENYKHKKKILLKLHLVICAEMAHCQDRHMYTKTTKTKGPTAQCSVRHVSRFIYIDGKERQADHWHCFSIGKF